MKRVLFLSAIVVTLFACNGAGTNQPTVTDTSKTMLPDSAVPGNMMPGGQGGSTMQDTLPNGGAKPDTTMRQ